MNNFRKMPNWRQVLSLLAAAPPPNLGDSLPALTQCPLCSQARLLIFDDAGNNSQWYYCESCSFRGGPEALLQEADEFADFAAICGALFGQALPETELQQRRHHLVERPQALWETWIMARPDHVFTKPGLLRILANAGLRADNSSWCQKLFKQTVRAMSADELSRRLTGVTERLPGKTYGRAQLYLDSGRSLFPSHFTDVLLLPCQDRPGRISGFFALGGEGSEKEQVLLREPGTASPGLFYAPQTLDDLRPLVIVDSPLEVLRQQLRAVKVGPDIPPFVGWFPQAKPTTDDWRALQGGSGRPLIFVQSEFKPAVVAQAITLGAKIREARQGNYEYLCEGATSWEEYLSAHLKKVTAAERTTLLRQLLSCGAPKEALTELCNKQEVLRQALGLLEFSTPGLRVIDWDGSRQIEERDSTWRCLKNGVEELVSPAVLRIERIVNYRQAGCYFYQGAVFYQGRRLDFVEPREKLDAAAGDWLHKLLLDKQCGYHTFSKTWAKRLVQVALKFHQPVVVTGLERVGWDDVKQRLVTARFTISKEGLVKSHRSLVLEQAKPQIGALAKPAKPGQFNLLALQRLLDLPELGAAFCNLLYSGLANLLAPSLNTEPRLTVVTGETAWYAAKLAARSLGAPVLEPKEALRQQRKHGWPVCVIDESPQQKTARACALELTNAYLLLQPLPALTLGLASDCDVVEYEQTTDAKASVELLSQALQPLLSEFLVFVNVNKRRTLLTGVAEKQPLPQLVRDNLAQWLQQTYGAPADLWPKVASERWLRRDPAQGGFRLFSCLLQELLRLGALEITPADFAGVKNACWLADNRLLLPRQLLLDVVARYHGLAIWPGTVTELLQQSNVGFSEERLHGRICWSFNYPA